MVVVPAPNEGPDVLAPLLELYAAIAMSLSPGEDLAQNSEVHAFEDG